MRTRWTDERLDDLAETLRPLPAEMAGVRAEVAILREDVTALQQLPGEVAGLREDVAALRGLPADVAALRGDLSATQRQMAQIGWAMAVGLLGTVAALIVALLA